MARPKPTEDVPELDQDMSAAEVLTRERNAEVADGTVEADMRFRSDRSGRKVSGPAPAVPLDARPKLPRGVSIVYEKASRRWVLLSPTRPFKADTIATEIVKRCTGEATVDAIVDDLAKIYSAPRSRILADVMAFLRGLSDKNLLEL